MGNAYVEKGIYDSAFLYYQLALDQIKPGIKELDLLHSQYDQFTMEKDRIYNIAGIGQRRCILKFYESTGKPDAIKEAVRIYKIADQLIDRIGAAEQTDPQIQAFWRADSRRLYEHGIEACYE